MSREFLPKNVRLLAAEAALAAVVACAPQAAQRPSLTGEIPTPTPTPELSNKASTPVVVGTRVPTVPTVKTPDASQKAQPGGITPDVQSNGGGINIQSFQVEPTPLATVNVDALQSRFIDKPMKAGEVLQAPAGSMVEGDSIVDGEAMKGNHDPKQGTLTYIEKSAQVVAPYDIDVQENTNPDSYQKLADDDAQLMLEKGCVDGKGCDTVVLTDQHGHTLKIYTKHGVTPQATTAAGSTQTATPAVTATPSATGETCEKQDYQLKPGQSVTTTTDFWVFQGDLTANGIVLNDNNAKTALEVEVNQAGTKLEAPYGGDASCFTNKKDQDAFARRVQQEAKATGKFTRVDLIDFPGKPQGQQASK